MTRPALIRALVEAAEALPLPYPGDGSAEVAAEAEARDAVMFAAYALRRARDLPRSERRECPDCGMIAPVYPNGRLYQHGLGTLAYGARRCPGSLTLDTKTAHGAKE